MTPQERKKLDSYYKRRYGVDYKFYETLWLLQGKSCALCARKPKKGQRRYALDHDHRTGKVRDILCYYCNKYRVGKLTLEWAAKITEYLRRHA